MAAWGGTRVISVSDLAVAFGRRLALAADLVAARLEEDRLVGVRAGLIVEQLCARTGDRQIAYERIIRRVPLNIRVGGERMMMPRLRVRDDLALNRLGSRWNLGNALEIDIALSKLFRECFHVFTLVSDSEVVPRMNVAAFMPSNGISLA